MEELSDDELRDVLAKHNITNVPVTSSTRGFLIQKLKRQTEEPAAGKNPFSSSECETKAEVVTLSESPPGGYYGVSKAPGTPDRLDMSPYYLSKAEAVKATKTYGPGARFKKFDSPKAAEAFAQHPAYSVQEKFEHAEADKPNQYPSVKTPDLSRLRMMIEAGKTAEFTDTVWANPRHLITSGDAPEILHVGSHHNALHCAAKSHRLTICKELIQIVESNRFWELIYPHDAPEIREKRKGHLLDLYLNMQDKIVSYLESTIASVESIFYYGIQWNPYNLDTTGTWPECPD